MKIKMLLAVGGAMFSVACGGGSLTGPAVELSSPSATAGDAIVATSEFTDDLAALLPTQCGKLLVKVQIVAVQITKTRGEARATYLTEKGEPITDCKAPTWTARGTKLELSRDPYMVQFRFSAASDVTLFALAPNGVQGRLDVKF